MRELLRAYWYHRTYKTCNDQERMFMRAMADYYKETIIAVIRYQLSPWKWFKKHNPDEDDLPF